jgi:hypothetical protein
VGEDRPIEIEYDGQTYTGWYRVHGAMITVTGPNGATTARLGSMASTPETLARMILLADLAEAAALRREKPAGWDPRIS